MVDEIDVQKLHEKLAQERARQFGVGWYLVQVLRDDSWQTLIGQETHDRREAFARFVRNYESYPTLPMRLIEPTGITAAHRAAIDQ